MINLIPSQDKKRMIKDFYSRLVTTSFVMLSFCVLILAVAVFPSYFSVVLKKNLVNQKLESQAQESLPEVDQRIVKIMDDIKTKLEILEKFENNKFLVSEKVIKEIVSKKTDQIKITKISYSNDPIKGKNISINGTAPSREQLLAFRRLLENDPLFKEVNLPISNFIKGSDIQFNLTLITS